jgi:hypothetical protein
VRIRGRLPVQRLALTAVIAVVGASAVTIPAWAVPVTSRAALALPNDPGFAGCERQDPITGCTDNEQWDLFGPLTGNTCRAPHGSVNDVPHPDGGLPCWALHATDPQHAAGVDMTGAWAQGNVGRDDVLIAYIEGGVNYRDDGIKDSLDNIYLNNGKLRIFTTGISGPVEALNGDGSVFATMSGACTSAACAPLPPYRPGDSLTVTLTGQGAIGDLRHTGTPEYLQSTVGAESLTAGLNSPGPAALPQTYEEAWNPASGSVATGFPRRQDGFPFFTAPLAADVGDNGTSQVIESNDSYWIHAFAVGGGEAPGFPKYTGQWPSFSGVVGDPELNGQMRLAYGTREGYLFVWKVRGAVELKGTWPHYRHDDRNTGLYGLDTIRPEAILDLRRGRGPRFTLTWTASGNDYQLGTAARYEIRMARTPITAASFWHARSLPGVPRPARAGTRQRMDPPALPAGVTYFAIRAIDAAGNVSALSDVVRVRSQR